MPGNMSTYSVSGTMASCRTFSFMKRFARDTPMQSACKFYDLNNKCTKCMSHKTITCETISQGCKYLTVVKISPRLICAPNLSRDFTFYVKICRAMNCIGMLYTVQRCQVDKVVKKFMC